MKKNLPFSPRSVQACAFVQVAFRTLGIHAQLKGLTDDLAVTDWGDLIDVIANTAARFKRSQSERSLPSEFWTKAEANYVDALHALIEYGPTVPLSEPADVQVAASLQVCNEFFGWGV